MPIAGKLRPDENPSTIIPGRMLAGVRRVPTSIPLVRNMPDAHPKKPADSSGFTPILGISVVLEPMPAPMVNPNGRYDSPPLSGESARICCSKSVSRKK